MTRSLGLGLLALALVASSGRAQSVRVMIDGIAREVPVVERQGHRFVSLESVARALGGQTLPAGPERAVLVVDEERLTVHRRSPFVQFEGRWFQMVEAAQKDARGFYLPASSLHQLLPVLWPGRFPRVEEESEVGRPARPIPEGGVESGMIGSYSTPDFVPRVDVWVQPDRTRLGFRLQGVPGIVVDDGLPGTLQLLVSRAEIDPGMLEGITGIGLVDSVSVAPAASGQTALTFWVAAGTSVYAVAPLRDPVGFELVLRSGAPDEAAILLASDVDVDTATVLRTTDRAVRDDAAGASPARRRVPRTSWMVVIDAGHGGEDPGSIGPRGTREKEITLAVARQLRDRLQREPGVEVAMTRTDDTFVPLRDRTRMANEAGADLFVSIHANAAESRAAEGFETYFLSAAKTEDEKRVARMENAAIRYENPEIDPESLSDLNFILWDLAQNEYLRESSALAAEIQEEVGRRLDLRSRGVKQAGFFVLNGAFMPAVLFEMAFITNPTEEALLNDPSFRARLVDGLADSLLRYLDQYGQKALVQRATG